MCFQRTCCRRFRAEWTAALYAAYCRSTSSMSCPRTSAIRICRITSCAMNRISCCTLLSRERAGCFVSGDFTVPASSAELLQRWMLSADSVRAWAAARLEITSYEHVIAVSALYHDFQAWAEIQGLKRDMLPSVISFGKRLRKAAPGLEYQRSDGSFCRNARLRRGPDRWPSGVGRTWFSGCRYLIVRTFRIFGKPHPPVRHPCAHHRHKQQSETTCPLVRQRAIRTGGQVSFCL